MTNIYYMYMYMRYYILSSLVYRAYTAACPYG